MRQPGVVEEGMRAVAPAGDGTIEIVTAPVPEPGPGEILIRVIGAGVNQADVLQAQGLHPPPAGVTPVLGLECAGIVAAVGAGVSDSVVGQSVCALLPGGGYAEFAAVPLGLTLLVPRGFSFLQAAALLETTATAWSNLSWQGGLRADDRVLIHAGTSGVGTAAIQMASAMGAEVAATARTEDGVDHCRQMGAHTAGRLDEPHAVSWWSRGQFDVVLDILGAPYLKRNLAALRTHGRLVEVGLVTGRQGNVDLEPLLRRQLTILGSGLRLRPDHEKSRILQEVARHVWPLMEIGRFEIPIDRVFALVDAPAAHRRISRGGTRGRVVLQVADSEHTSHSEQEAP